MKNRKTNRTDCYANVKVHERPHFPRPAVFRSGKEYDRQRMKNELARIAAYL